MLSVQQRVEIVLLMAKLESVTSVRRTLQGKNWKSIPSENTIRNVFSKFKETGTVHNLPKQGRPSLDEETIEEINKCFADKPASSLRNIANKVGCSFKTVHNVAKNQLNLFPYKIQTIQAMEEEDCALRVSMCETLLTKINADSEFIHNLIFSDESTFYLNGMVNRHNCRIWGMQPPTEIISKSHSSPKVNVWMGHFFLQAT